MLNPTVQILEVTDTLANIDSTPVGELFGRDATDEQQMLEHRIRLMRLFRGREQCRAFLLTWQDVRVPVGAEVAGHVIRWTQHGLVRDDNDDIIGTYFRLADEARERQMLVFVQPTMLALSA
jgi:hypothetical protein